MRDTSAAFFGGEPLPYLVRSRVPFVVYASDEPVECISMDGLEDSCNVGCFLKKAKGLAKLSRNSEFFAIPSDFKNLAADRKRPNSIEGVVLQPITHINHLSLFGNF